MATSSSRLRFPTEHASHWLIIQEPSTLIPTYWYQYVYQIVDGLYKHGARKILVLNGHGGNIKTIERIGLEFDKKGAMVVMLNWWLMAWDMKPEWKGGHGGGEETAGIMAVDPLTGRYEQD